MVAIIAPDEDSLGANGFSHYCGDEEAEECGFHGCVEGFLKNGVLQFQNCVVLYCEL